MTNEKHIPGVQLGNQFRIEDVSDIFDAAFLASYNTRLLLGADDPVYIPASNRYPHHRIYFAHGFFRSALHEIAHWCIAGKVRRHIVDYGYWYKPDGRSLDEQRMFERVECKPQALEWLFCLSSGHPFEVSCDNLAAEDPSAINIETFTEKVAMQLGYYAEHGLPQRAAIFASALQRFYRQPDPLQVLKSPNGTQSEIKVA